MSEKLNKLIMTALEDLKGQDIKQLDVTSMSDVMDELIIVSGTSNRHVKSLANNVVETLKEHQIRPIGVEGLEDGEWVLVDYGDAVVHIMLPATRSFYELEKLWSKVSSARKDDADRYNDRS